MSKMKVAVIGATVFAGQHLAEELSSREKLLPLHVHHL